MTNRSKLRETIMTIIYQIALYKKNNMGYNVDDVIKENLEIDNEFVKDIVYGVVTSFDELTSLDETIPSIRNIHVSAEEDDGKLVFLHKIKEGAADKSYGVHVAALAGMPEEIIDEANLILSKYENKETSPKIEHAEQITFNLSEEKNELKEYLKDIDPLKLTPIEALIKLNELKEISKKS